MLSKYFRYLTLIIAAGITMVSCSKSEKVGETAVKAVAGQWWIQIGVDGSLIDPRYFTLLTYNTSDNSTNQFWLDDTETIWPFKFKSNLDLANKTFSVSNAASEYSGITITVANGKILEGVSKGPASGAVTDSIYFEAEFSDDPGTTYQFSGYRRTRFGDDDH